MKSRIKTVIIGPSRAGKTSLINQYIYQLFQNQYIPTFAGQLSSYRLNDPIQTLVQIWDLSGAQYFRPISSIYYQDADIVAIVYDPNSYESNQAIQQYLQKISELNLENVTIGLVANYRSNKFDKQCINRTEKINYLIEELNCLHFCVNAKTGENVQQFFNEIIEICKSKFTPPYVTTESDITTEEQAPSISIIKTKFNSLCKLCQNPLIHEVSIGLLFFLDII